MIYIDDAIEVDPPIPFTDVTAKAALDHDSAASRPRYVHQLDEVSIGDLTFAVDHDHPRGPCASAIIPWDGDGTGGRNLFAALERIITDFARTTDGTPRTFTGHLEYEDGDDGARYRLYVRGGAVVTEEPELVWPPPPPGEPTGIPATDPTAEAFPAPAPANTIDTTAEPGTSPEPGPRAEGATR